MSGGAGCLPSTVSIRRCNKEIDANEDLEKTNHNKAVFMNDIFWEN